MQPEARSGRRDAAAAHPLAELLACPPDTGNYLTGSTLNLQVEAGQPIFRQLEQCKGLYVIVSGHFLRKGCPKSLYRPGSSTDVLIFEPDRIEFCPDLVINSSRSGVHSRFSGLTWGPLVETDIKVRSPLARRREGGSRFDLYSPPDRQRG